MTTTGTTLIIGATGATGATGTTGSRTAARLTAAGHRVRAASRHAAPVPGAEPRPPAATPGRPRSGGDHAALPPSGPYHRRPPRGAAPDGVASMLAALDRAIAAGAEDRVTGTVQQLTARPAGENVCGQRGTAVHSGKRRPEGTAGERHHGLTFTSRGSYQDEWLVCRPHAVTLHDRELSGWCVARCNREPSPRTGAHTARKRRAGRSRARGCVPGRATAPARGCSRIPSTPQRSMSGSPGGPGAVDLDAVRQLPDRQVWVCRRTSRACCPLLAGGGQSPRAAYLAGARGSPSTATVRNADHLDAPAS